MDERTLQVFFEIHRDLPREGPGNAAATRRAFELIPELPEDPRILDIGCGPGMQTLDLARLTRGEITAVDNHQPFLDELARRASGKRLSERIRIVNGDMAALGFADDSFDLIWSEGAAYIMGWENALRSWRRLLWKPGYLAATEVSWLRSDAPEDLQRFWDEEYPAIQTVDENLAAVRRAGYEAVGNFTLPAAAWWDDYYTPLTQRLAKLREKYAGDAAALEVVEMHDAEMELHRRYADYYGYVFYVMRAD